MDPRIVRVVGLAIIPNHLQIIEYFLQPLIPLFFQLPQDSRQVHRMLDNRWIISQPHSFPINRLPEVKRLVGLIETVDDDPQFFDLILAEFGAGGEPKRGPQW